MEILYDTNTKPIEPILHLKPSFTWRNGIFSEIDKALSNLDIDNGIIVKGNRPRQFYEYFLKQYQIENFDLIPLDVSESHKTYKPENIINHVDKRIIDDTKYIDQTKYDHYAQQKNFEYKGDAKDLWCGKNITISQQCVIDTQNGPVILGDNTNIGPFSFLKGPLFIGDHTQLHQISLSNSVVGQSCRLSGEITQCIIGNFSNKNHAGFVGHSIIGDWVNIGAMATTSNLKNNYGNICLEYQGNSYQTKQIKFGSIIADFSKIGIGTLLNTGTIIDIGANIIHRTDVQKYYPPFFWLDSDTLYEYDKFLRDNKTMMKRRNQNLSHFIITRLYEIYSFQQCTSDFI